MFQDTFNVMITFLCCAAAFVRNKRWTDEWITDTVTPLVNKQWTESSLPLFVGLRRDNNIEH